MATKSKKFDLVGAAIKTGALGAGALASKTLDSLPFIKEQSTPIKAGAKIAIGAALSLIGLSNKKNDAAILPFVGYGAMSMGAYQMAQHFFPQLGITGIPFDAPIALPISERVEGMPVEITGMAIAEDEQGQGVNV